MINLKNKIASYNFVKGLDHYILLQVRVIEIIFFILKN